MANEYDKPDNKGKNSEPPVEKGRRKAVRRMLVGGGIISAGSQVSGRWVRPTVDSSVLPAHAQTTDEGGGSPTTPTPAPTTPGAPTPAPTDAPPPTTPSVTPSPTTFSPTTQSPFSAVDV